MTLADRVAARDARAVARAITTVERGGSPARELLRALAGRTAPSVVIGITGPAGTGKSTLVDRLTARWRGSGRRVGILAIDPSSPYSGGAILGDRVRMQAHAGDPGVFIRSMATRGHAGGLARATRDAACVLEAAGFDLIVVETVGVGQAEVEIVRVADVTVVVLAPGAGDEIQALKAGLMEVADLFVVNKADREGADRAAASITAMLSLAGPSPEAWRPRVLTAAATAGEGVADIVAALDEIQREGGGRITARREARRAGPCATKAGPQIDHVGIAVSAPEGLCAFLEGALGFSVGPGEDVPGAGVRVRFAGEGETRLELIEPLGAASAIEPFLARRGPGLHHVAVRVESLADTLAALQARGIRLIDDAPRPGAGGTRIAFVHPSSAGGVLVELVEHDQGAGR